MAATATKEKPSKNGKPAKGVNGKKPKQDKLFETAPEGCEVLCELAAKWLDKSSERGSLGQELKELKDGIAAEMKSKGMKVFKHEGLSVTLVEAEPKIKIERDGEGAGEEADGEDDAE